jgi:putative ABC transport system permease protein
VLVEGVVISVIGAAVGLILGLFGASLLVDALSAQAFVSPDASARDMGGVVLVRLLIGVLGGLYPAFRAAQLSPAKVVAQR